MIHGCYRKRGGILRVVKAGMSCRRNEAAVKWNQQGPQGPKGQDGAAGAPATSLWAVVNSAGSLERGSGVAVPVGTDVSADRNTRDVPFDRDLTGCAWVATIGGADLLTGTVAGFINTSLTATNTVKVPMTNTTGGMVQNQDFHLAVFCP